MLSLYAAAYGQLVERRHITRGGGKEKEHQKQRAEESTNTGTQEENKGQPVRNAHTRPRTLPHAAQDKPSKAKVKREVGSPRASFPGLKGIEARCERVVVKRGVGVASASTTRVGWRREIEQRVCSCVAAVVL